MMAAQLNKAVRSFPFLGVLSVLWFSFTDEYIPFSLACLQLFHTPNLQLLNMINSALLVKYLCIDTIKGCAPNVLKLEASTLFNYNKLER